jgi:ABC-type glutathione transport system ATPase component
MTSFIIGKRKGKSVDHIMAISFPYKCSSSTASKPFHSPLQVSHHPRLEGRKRSLTENTTQNAIMATCSTHDTTSLHSPCTTVSNKGFRQKQVIFFTSNRRRSRRHGGSRTCFQVSCSVDKPVVIGLAADSGCGKSTFMHRLTSVFGGAAVPPKGGNPDSNTLISDTTTVICLDDYHSLDRNERKDKVVTALDPRANNFDLSMSR